MHLSEHIQQKPDERIIHFLRRHWIIFAVDVLIVIVLAGLPLLGYALFKDSAWAPRGPVITLLASTYYLSIWLVFFTKFVDYYLDTWIVTNDRVLDIRQDGLFSRTVAELDLAKVQDVTSEVKGVIPSILDFGNVYVQTAGEVQRFVFAQIPHPHKVRQEILNLVEEDRKRQHESA